MKRVWITNHVLMQTMGTGFETWAASHIVERNNKTLITPGPAGCSKQGEANPGLASILDSVL